MAAGAVGDPAPTRVAAAQPRVDPAQPQVDAWLERLRTERGAAPLTIAAYRRDLARLVALARGTVSGAAGGAAGGAAAGAAAGGAAGGAAAGIDWSRVGEAQVRRWVALLARDGLGARSIARVLSAWRGFFDWLAEHEGLVSNPVRPVRAPRRPRHLPKALPVDETIRLVEPAGGASPIDFEALRDQAMVELLYSSGLRLSELTSLDARHEHGVRGEHSRSWFDAAAAEVTVLGKGGKTRSVPVGRKAMAALERWLDARREWLDANPSVRQPALFLTRRGTRLSNRSVQMRLRALALRRDVPTQVHPHVLRHSFASHMLQSSGDLRAVQELLGHANIATTQIYTSLDFQRLASVYDAAHPRARRVPASAVDGTPE
ncbi:MAG: tyrosine recombinase XerC [Lautropia sp.]